MENFIAGVFLLFWDLKDGMQEEKEELSNG